MGQGASVSVRNETEITLWVELMIMVPYYYGEVKPGQTFVRATGSVWFTVNVKPADPDSTRTQQQQEVGEATLNAAVGTFDTSSGGLGTDAVRELGKLATMDHPKDPDAETPYWAKVLYGPNQIETQVDIGARRASHDSMSGVYAAYCPTIVVTGGYTPNEPRRPICLTYTT